MASCGIATWLGTNTLDFCMEQLDELESGGIVEDTDLTVRVDYLEGLDSARLVYTPELRDQALEASPEANDSSIEGGITNSPPYLLELHNRLALRTA